MSKSPMRFLTSALLCTAALAAAAEPFPALVCDGLGLPKNYAVPLTTIATAQPPDKKELSTRFTQLEAAALAQNLVLLKLTYVDQPDFITANTIFYLDLDNDLATGRADKYHRGTDLMVTFSGRDATPRPFTPDAKNTRMAATTHENTAWLLLQTSFPASGKDTIAFSVHLLCEFRAQGGVKASQSCPPTNVTLPILTSAKPIKPTLGVSASLVPLSFYNYYNDKIALLPLADKGLTAEQVMAAARPIQPERPMPIVTLPDDGPADKPVAGDRLAININLLEEAGIARQPARIRVGVPFPQGRVFQTKHLTLRDNTGKIRPAQFAVMTLWPDQSLKWVLTQFDAELNPKANLNWTLTAGPEAAPAPQPSPLRLTETDSAITIATGALNATIDKRQFAFAELAKPGQESSRLRLAAVLRDEQGRPFTTAALPPSSIRIEEQGPERIVIRVEGNYGNDAGEKLMSYIARMTFHRQSSIMELAWTHLNSEINREFTDVTSLDLELTAASPARALEVAGADLQGNPFSGNIKLTPDRPNLAIFQRNDLEAEASGALRGLIPALDAGKARINGSVAADFADSRLTVGFQDFWQRWPKAVTLADNRLTFGILPRQPSADFGQDLPFWLVFPFCEGKYRTKWGMAFTERISIDVGGATSRAEMAANRDLPVIAVIPAAWYHQCQVFGDVSVPNGKQFAAWDEWFENCANDILNMRERQREYGYFNLGDTFGERGRNWTNNEYDPAHGLFMQFVRTGNRKYARLGLETARHQADVDIVHAYPDPYYIGANHQHSIGHTGQWSQVPLRATWTHRYDGHTSAENGHTWVEGMADAWCLTAEPRTIEAAYALGEHITWGMSKTFTRLGTHERSAGWSMKAILCLYRYLGDPVYLEAARRIVEVPLREQKFDQGGAWPHVLPGDHSGIEPGATGNAIFLIGVLLSGIKDYYEVTGDPRAATSIIAGARWLLLCYDSDVCGWPYTARVDGKPLFEPAGGSTAMAPQAVAFAGKLTGEKAFIDAAYDTIETMVARSGSSSGKAFGSNTLMILNALGIIQQWYLDHEPDKAATLLSGNIKELRMKKTRDAKGLQLRAPDRKTFFAKLQGDSAELTLTRTPTGAAPKRSLLATITVTNQAGTVVATETCSTDKPFTYTTKLTGKPGDEFSIVVDDDRRAHWSAAGLGLKVVGKLVPESSMAQIRTARYYFLVPAGTKSFRMKITGVHSGPYGCTIQAPDGSTVAEMSGRHFGEAQLPHLKGVTNSQWLDVSVGKARTGEPWTAIFSATGDFGIEFDGIPPYLAISKDQLFLPNE